MLGFIPVFIGVVQGIHYFNRSERDYIYMEEERMTIYRGPLLPNITIEYNDIHYCVAKNEHELMVIMLVNGQEKQFKTDLVSDEDLSQIREKLKQRTNVEKLFRTNVE
ncbi:hypothetical protein [Virgibacillus tibetensis]